MSAGTFPARPALDQPAAATVPAYEWAAACRRDMVAVWVAGMDDAQRSVAWAACLILGAALDAYALARIRDEEQALVAQAALTPDASSLPLPVRVPSCPWCAEDVGWCVETGGAWPCEGAAEAAALRHETQSAPVVWIGRTR